MHFNYEKKNPLERIITFIKKRNAMRAETSSRLMAIKNETSTRSNSRNNPLTVFRRICDSLKRRLGKQSNPSTLEKDEKATLANCRKINSLNAFQKLTYKLKNDHMNAGKGYKVFLPFTAIENCIERPLQGIETTGKWWTNSSFKRQSRIWRNAGFHVSCTSLEIEMWQGVQFEKHEISTRKQIVKVLLWIITTLLVPILIIFNTNCAQVRHILNDIEYNYSIKEYSEAESLILQNFDKIQQYSSTDKTLRLYEIMCDIKTHDLADMPGTSVNYINREEFSSIQALTQQGSQLAYSKKDTRYFLFFCQKYITACLNQYAATMDLEYMNKASTYIEQSNRYLLETGFTIDAIDNQEAFLAAIEFANLKYAHFLYDYFSIVYSYSKLRSDQIDTVSFAKSWAGSVATDSIIEDYAYGTEWLTENYFRYLELRKKLVLLMTNSIYNSIGETMPTIVLRGKAHLQNEIFFQSDYDSLMNDIIILSQAQNDYDTLAFIHLLKARICFFEYFNTGAETQRIAYEDSLSKWLIATEQSEISMVDYERFFAYCVSGWQLEQYISDLEELLQSSSFSENEKFKAFLYLQLGTHYFYQAIEKTVNSENIENIIPCFKTAYSALGIAKLYYYGDDYRSITSAIDTMQMIALLAEDDVHVALGTYYDMLD